MVTACRWLRCLGRLSFWVRWRLLIWIRETQLLIADTECVSNLLHVVDAQRLSSLTTLDCGSRDVGPLCELLLFQQLAQAPRFQVWHRNAPLCWPCFLLPAVIVA